MNLTRKFFFGFCFASLGFTSGLYAQKDIGAKLPTHDSDKVYISNHGLSLAPKFPGDINRYLVDSIRYPEEARKNNIQGKVYISFIVEKDGSISNVKVVRGDNESLSNEAKRLISAMPKWRSGRKNGIPVRVQYMVPVTFKL